MDSLESRLLEVLKCRTEGLVALEVEKSADAQVFARLQDYYRQLGMKPTSERVNGLFSRLATKGTK